MMEANPPAQPDKKELRRRILFLIKEKDRQDEYRHLFQIASDLEETPAKPHHLSFPCPIGYTAPKR